MELNRNNYFSLQAQIEYMGVSQFKAFGQCEAAALAEIKGQWQQPKTTALLVGSYVDAYFEGSLDLFKAENAEIFTQKGELKAPYKQADEIIARVERDKFFMRFMDGEKQVIRTGEIDGVPIKIKIDVLHPKMIVDLKVMKDFKPMWKDKQLLTFAEAWGYDLQGAVYQAIEGSGKPFIIAGVTKEAVPDIALYKVPQEFMDERLKYFKSRLKHYADIKKGLIEPIRCEHCDYCKATKVLSQVVDLRELIYEME